MNQLFRYPELKVLRKEWPSQVNLAHVDELVAAMWDGTTRRDIQELLVVGALEGFTSGECLVLIETQDWPAGRELLIYGMAGRGILTQADDVVHDLKALARYKACKWIGAHGIPLGWSRIGPRLGFAPVSTHYMMELDDGR